MKIATLKGEKNVEALSKRLLGLHGKTSAKKSAAELAAALLRVNPQLENVGKLEPGTTVLVPDEFALAPEEASRPADSLGAAAMARMEKALADARAFLAREQTKSPQATELEAWLKGDRAKKSSKETAVQNKVLTNAATTIKAVAKEQAESPKAHNKSLDTIEKKFAAFREQHAS